MRVVPLVLSALLFAHPSSAALFDDLWSTGGLHGGATEGSSIATAGDVNGDGYSDILVGTPRYGFHVTLGGLAQLFLGSASGPTSPPVWSYHGLEAYGHVGKSVSTAGDVNGDGYDDVIIGVPGYEGQPPSEGQVLVFHGSSEGLADTPDFSFVSGWNDAELGAAVCAAGDVNGDGYDDIVVGAPHLGGGLLAVDQGAAWVFYGSATGLHDDDRTWLLGGQQGEHFGSAVAGAGDVNGDGYDDVAIGSPDYSTILMFILVGRVEVFYGSPTGVAINYDWGTNGTVIEGHLGCSVSTAGDVNADGYADLIIGEKQYDDGVTTWGRALVFHGSATGLSATADWDELGTQDHERFGHAVSTAGDANGDGYADVVVGAPFYSDVHFEGRAAVYLGSASGLATSPAWNHAIGAEFSGYGKAVACAGDTDGNGISEILIGAPDYDTPQSQSGYVELRFGETGTLTNSAWRADGDEAGAFFGLQTAWAGDVNGDGFDDLIAGAYGTAGERGEARVFHGSAWGLSTPALPIWRTVGEAPGEYYGNDVSGAGDVNGDGYGDVIVSAGLHDNGESDEGKAYVYHGSSFGLSTTAAWTVETNQVDGRLSRVANAGDVNGDGYGDVLVAALGWDAEFQDQGKAWCYPGSSTGLSHTAIWSIEGIGLVDFLGEIATAGDVNGDGYSDILVGAGNTTNTVLGEGWIGCFHGSARGPSATPDWEIWGGEIGAHLQEVSFAGDVNGDGYADVIVGSRYIENPLKGTGMVWIYHGSATGLETMATTELYASATGSSYGRAVGCAGDVNGDGYSDVIVGGTEYTQVHSKEGAAWVYLGSTGGIVDSAVWARRGDQVDAYFGRSVGTCGDVDGDGFSDLFVAAAGQDDTYLNEGRVYLYLGNARLDEDPALSKAPRQRRTDGEPLAYLGLSDSRTAFDLALRGRSPAGRTGVKLEWAVEELGTDLPVLGFSQSGWTDSGTVQPNFGSGAELTQPVAGLSENTLYHWRVRLRTRSPWFPRSRWMTLGVSVPSLAHLRTAPASVAAPPQLSRSHIESIRPNPFNPTAEIVYQLDAPGKVSLQVLDLRGRLVATLVDEVQSSGRRKAVWHGRDDRERPVASGVYLFRLRFEAEEDIRKVALVR